MYKALATAVLLAATTFPLPLQGQMRAMHHPSGPARITVGSPFRSTQPHSNGFGVTRSSPFVRRSAFVRSFGSRHHHRFHIFFGNVCFSDPFSDPFFCGQFFFRNRFFFAQPLFLPYPVYASSPYYQVAEQTSATTSDQDPDLASEVNRLKDEIERLRDEERSREGVRAASHLPPSAEAKAATTILVFRDGRRSEIQNYAIVGQRLWMLTERRARKLAMSDLDVEATRKLNADRGVEFRTP